MPTQVNQVPDSWVFDPVAVENNISRKTRQPMWRNVVATLRLIDGAERTTGTSKVHLLQAAVNRLARARVHLVQHGHAEPAFSHWTAFSLTGGIRALDGMRDDADWLRDALAGPDEPPATHIVAILDSLADNLCTVLWSETAERFQATASAYDGRVGLTVDPTFH